VAFQTPTASATVSGTATVQVSATDNSGIASVSFYVDGTLTGVKSVAPYTWALNSTTLANGGHTLKAVAQNTLGSSAENSIPVNVSNVAPTVTDTTAPVLSITSPGAGATVNGNITVQISASDNIRVTSVDLLIDGQLVGTTTTAPFSIKYNAKNLSNGYHNLQARARDAAGNIGLSAVVTVRK
jgi:hypothetical protein